MGMVVFGVACAMSFVAGVGMLAYLSLHRQRTAWLLAPSIVLIGILALSSTHANWFYLSVFVTVSWFAGLIVGSFGAAWGQLLRGQ